MSQNAATFEDAFKVPVSEHRDGCCEDARPEP